MSDALQEPTVGPGEVEALGRTGRTIHLFFVLLTLFVAGTLLWSHYGMLDVMSMAQGEVVPADKVHLVQHLEGGIVREILVREGEGVTLNQPLVVLESTATAADVKELEVRIGSKKIDMIRHAAEAAGREELEFPATLRQRFPVQVEQATALFRSRHDSLRAALDGRDNEIRQRRQSIAEISARRTFARKTLKNVREQLAIFKSLMQQKLSNRLDQLKLQREAIALEGKIQEDRAALKRAEAALAQSESAMEETRMEFRAQAQARLEEAQRYHAEFSERLKKFQDHFQRTTLQAPVAGIVKVIHVSNERSVVPPGGTVMELVPGGNKVVVEAQLFPQEVGFVHPGQNAIIQLASNEASQLGNIPGIVEQISPDTLITDQGIPYYKVRITTPHRAFEKNGRRYPLIPGVMVTAGIITDRRSVLSYLLAPFLSNARFMFSER